MTTTTLIDPKNQTLWTAAAFVVALLALVVALGSLQHTNNLLLVTQTEVLMLNKKIEDQSKGANGAVPAAPAPVAAAR
jgi:hypothetical protein